MSAQVVGSSVYFTCRKVANYSPIPGGLFAANYTDDRMVRQLP